MKKDGCLTSRVSGKEGVYSALAGNTSREVVHITVQDLFWLVSIVWIIVQLWDRVNSSKGK